MLTSKQTTIRLRDAEISRLRKENERLNNKLRQIRLGFIDLLKALAKDMGYLQKSQMLKMADELNEENEVAITQPPTTQQKGE